MNCFIKTIAGTGNLLLSRIIARTGNLLLFRIIAGTGNLSFLESKLGLVMNSF